MGLEVDRESFDEAEYERFAERLRESLDALKRLLQRPGFGRGPSTLGAEVEMVIVDGEGYASPVNQALLRESVDSRLQLELDSFNLECNLSPVPAAGAPFWSMQQEMQQALGALEEIASRHGCRLATIGILPTLRQEDLQSSAMTDAPRYRALSAGLRRLRKEPFRINISGAEPLTVSADDVTLEGANTSCQLHVRVDPEDYADLYNALQLVTAPALAVSTNSPFFLGHSLWEETRIALFKQSVDTRGAPGYEWRRPPRVSFGTGWVRDGVYELFAQIVRMFPPLLPILDDEEPLGCLQAGKVPRLSELRLHSGTVWHWNRPVYDPSDGGHVRIEARALPAGPTVTDMVASAALLIGLAWGLKPHVRELLPAMPFDFATWNFYRSAQHGLDAQLLWPEPMHPSPRALPCRELVQRLLPLAQAGLYDLGVDQAEIDRVLSVVRERLRLDMTGARWQRRRYAKLRRVHSRHAALQALLEEYLWRAASGQPVHTWGS